MQRANALYHGTCYADVGIMRQQLAQHLAGRYLKETAKLKVFFRFQWTYTHQRTNRTKRYTRGRTGPCVQLLPNSGPQLGEICCAAAPKSAKSDWLAAEIEPAMLENCFLAT